MNHAGVKSDGSNDVKRVNKAIAYGCRLLGVREYSQTMLRRKMLSKGYDLAECAEAIEYLIANGWQNDTRFCEAFVRSKISRGQGRTRIRAELGHNGIAQEMIDRAFEAEPICWQKLCDQVAERKVNSSNLSADSQGRQKLDRFLRYRGFSAEQCQKASTKHLTPKR